MVATRQVHTLQEKIVEERRSNRSKIREEIDKIKQIKLEKFDQLYHLVEFGRLSASFFHDLMSPLTHLNLEISQWAKLAQSEQKVVIEALPKVIESSKRIERIIISAKKYIQSKEQSQYFSVDSELYAAIDSLDYRAKQQGVDILVYADKEISSYGNQLKFNHVITNIIANAIDAYQPLPTNRRPFAVYCNLHQEDHTIVLSVTDYGCGIPADALEHIFDPFFTTKSSNLGSGIGLSSAKHIIEKCFHGNISIRSMVNHGTTFTIAIPHERLPALSASV